jgi:hypothetical protein
MTCSPSRPELHVFYMLLLHFVTGPALASSFDVELFVSSAWASCVHGRNGMSLTVNPSGGELPCGDFVAEQDFELAISSAFGFRKAKIAVKRRDEIGPQEEQSAPATPVPLLWAEHTGHELLDDDSDAKVDGAGNDNGLLADSG